MHALADLNALDQDAFVAAVAILAAFPVCLQHDPAQEVETARAEIARIAWLRLVDAVCVMGDAAVSLQHHPQR